MPRFNKTRQQLKTQQDKWFYAIKNLSELDSIPEELKQDIFERFFQAAEVGKLPPGEKQRYEQSLKYYRDLNNVIDTAFDEGEQKGIEKGLEQGIEQGIEKGLEQGIEQGIERGIEQGAALEKSNIAKAMLKNGLSVDQVVSMTGLTKQQIESL
jgi:predicted transposase/invertase (TIGR01784 family)